jgi:hypothetical protein
MVLAKARELRMANIQAKNGFEKALKASKAKGTSPKPYKRA